MSVRAFLKQRAVNIAVGGNYSLANWYDQNGKPRNFACRTSRVSPFRMIVDVPVVGRVGDAISSYFSDFGKLDGHISDTVPGGFLLELAVTRAMRERTFSGNFVAASGWASAIHLANLADQSDTRPGTASAS